MTELTIGAKSPWNSKTIRSAVYAIIGAVLFLAYNLFGVELPSIDDRWVDGFVTVLMLLTQFGVIQGRSNPTIQPIKPIGT